MKDVEDHFKDGVSLCHLINVMFGPFGFTIKKINKKGSAAFLQMENIGNFVDACSSDKVGCKKGDLFTTADLFDGKNIPQVILNLTVNKTFSYYNSRISSNIKWDFN